MCLFETMIHLLRLPVTDTCKMIGGVLVKPKVINKDNILND